MDLNREQVIGVVLTVIGFVATAVYGYWLASLDLTTGDLAVRGMMGFVLVAPLFVYGAYRYVRGTRQETVVVNEEMVPQRAMIDLINARGSLPLADLAAELGADLEDVKAMLLSLLQLRIFSGYVDWEAGVVYSRAAREAQQRRMLE